MKKKHRRKRKYKLQDMTFHDNLILSEAYHLSYKNLDSFMCFGYHYSKLRALGFINNENVVTHDGINYLHDLYVKQEKKRRRTQ